MPNSVSPVNDNVKELIRIVFPQGWAFFTKTPRELMVDIYSINRNQLSLINYSNVDANNLLGFSRSSRYISFELGKIMDKIPKNAWKNKTGNIGNNIPKRSQIVRSAYKFKYFKSGEYIVIQYKQIPWAWTKSSQEKNRPYFIARISLL